MNPLIKHRLRAGMTSHPPKPARPRWRVILLGCLATSLVISLGSQNSAYARGVFWLPTQTATDATFDHLNPVLVAYHNHAYALSVRVNGDSPTTSVIFSTNEAGHWSSTVLSDQGPHNTYSGDFTSLAVDASTGQLYAAWAYTNTPQADAIGVWTRPSGGQWSGPTDVFSGGSLGGQPSIVAGNGRAFVTFISATNPGACENADPPGYRSGDVQVVAHSGSSWSPAQNLTSCVPDTTVHVFDNAKLALDEGGHAYLVSSAEGDLWYHENTGGTWSDPVQITNGATIPASVGTSLRTFYGIAASNGTAFVSYVQQTGEHTFDVKLVSHQTGGGWSAPVAVSPPDSFGCPKFGLALVASGTQVGVSYLRAHTGYCAAASGVSGNVPSVYVGAPGALTAVGSLLGSNPDCFSSALADEGGLLRSMVSCDQSATLGKGQLYYAAEFLDTVGPVARLIAPASAPASGVSLRWSARDPQPGSGVANYQLQVRDGSKGWHTALATTTTTRFVYRQGLAGHRYTFRLRARDRTGNWGAWSLAKTLVHR